MVRGWTSRPSYSMKSNPPMIFKFCKLVTPKPTSRFGLNDPAGANSRNDSWPPNTDWSGVPLTTKRGQPPVTTEAACAATGSRAKVHNHSSFLSITSLRESDEQGNNRAEA